MKNWHLVTERPSQQASAINNPGFDVPAASSAAYDAGKTGGRRLRHWRPSSAGPNSVMVHSIGTIRARSRNATRNDPWAGAALDRSMFNGIGVGISATMVNGTKEQKAHVAELWRIFMEQCDADGCITGEAQQGLAWHEWGEAGEIFGRLRQRRITDGFRIPLQVQLLEAEMLDNTLFTTASNGNEVRYGIEFDKIGRRVAYWFWKEHPGDYVYTRNPTGERTRVPASSVIHLYRPTRAGQMRGIPDAVSALIRMHNVDNMDDAVLERQKIGALFAGFLETDGGQSESLGSMVDEMTEGQAEVDADDVPLAGLEPGTMAELPPGQKAVFSNPPTPGTEYAEYLRTHLLAIAARYGVPYEVLTGDLRNVSDRSLRLILNEFRRGLETKQWQFFIPMFCQPIRNAFFDAAYLAGELDGVIDDYAEQPEKYKRTLWVPQGWPYSHPVQDVDADRKAMRAGLASPTAKILSTGEQPDQVLQEFREFYEAVDELGLVFDSDPRKTDGSGKMQASSDPTDDDEEEVDPNQPPPDTPDRPGEDDDVEDDEDDED